MVIGAAPSTYTATFKAACAKTWTPGVSVVVDPKRGVVYGLGGDDVLRGGGGAGAVRRGAARRVATIVSRVSTSTLPGPA